MRNMLHIVVPFIVILIFTSSVCIVDAGFSVSSSSGWPYYFDGPPAVNSLIWETDWHQESLDPHAYTDPNAALIQYNVYETLYAYSWESSDTDTLLPLLAADYPTISPNGKNYTIPLREGVVFHDGTPFNASCVKWNFIRLIKMSSYEADEWALTYHLNGTSEFYDVGREFGYDSTEFYQAFEDWTNHGAITVIDEYTIRFTLAKPYPFFQSILVLPICYIMSPTYVLSHAESGFTDWDTYSIDFWEIDSYMERHMCGTGPFEFVEFQYPYFSSLTKFDDYWRSSTLDSRISPSSFSGYFDEILIRQEELEFDRINNLHMGRTDGCDITTDYIENIISMTTGLSRSSDVNVSTDGLSYDIRAVGMNQGEVKRTPGGSLMTSPFSNIHFRRAMTWAFDYQEFIDNTLDGFGVKGNGPIPIGMDGHNGTQYQSEFNITRAVEEWNLAMADSSFVYILNNMGNKLTFSYTDYTDDRLDFLTPLKSSLELLWGHEDASSSGLALPMTCELQLLDSNDYFLLIINRWLMVWDWDYKPLYTDASDPLYVFGYHQGGCPYRLGYNNSAINTWYDLAEIEQDSTERNRLFDLIQEQIAEDAVYLWLYQIGELRNWRQWLMGDGLAYNPMHHAYFYELYKDLPEDDQDPVLIGPDFALVPFNMSGHRIVLQASDDNPLSVEIIIYPNVGYWGYPWDGTDIEIVTEYLPLDNYTLFVWVYDVVGNTANHTMLLNLTEDWDSIPTLTNTTNNTGPFSFLGFDQTIILAIGGGSVIMVIVIILYRRRNVPQIP